MITLDRKLIRGGVTPELLGQCLARHDARRPELERLRAYYEGRDPETLGRSLNGDSSHARLPHPYARYIALTAAGYLCGRPIRYAAPG